MASDDELQLADLKSALSGLTRAYAEACASPKPTYTTEEGRTVRWQEYLEMLSRQINATQTMIQEMGGPWLEVSEGYLA